VLVAWWSLPVRFVGRERELARLRAALGGDIRLVLVTGDAGVGKTRFMAEGTAQAAAGGLLVAWGECLPLADELPLLPVAAALADLARAEGGAVLEAALTAAPGWIREEVGQLLPGLAQGSVTGSGSRVEAWRRERLFAAVAALLGALALRARIGLVVEDVHWADSATLDCLTFLVGSSHDDAVRVAVTCRGDEARLAAHVAEWLALMRGRSGVVEIRLGPMSRAEVAEQAAALAGGPVPPDVVDELYARAEGNPFFTEQLMSAAADEQPDGRLRVPSGLPGRLAELLTARADRCAGDSQVVLAALAVAGRPLTEALLSAITGLEEEAISRGLRELATARLLAEPEPAAGHRPRHALLAEAVAAGLLPAERAGLHGRIAQALQEAGGEAVAAEAAAHWQAAGRPAEELPARIAAAGAAERVFGYAQAAAQLRRAVELCRAHPTAAASVDLPQLYARAADAAAVSGDRRLASELAGEAYRLFADHPDPEAAAMVCRRASHFVFMDQPDRRLAVLRQALSLFKRAPVSAEYAEGVFAYAIALYSGPGRLHDALREMTRALELAEAAGATALQARILAYLASDVAEAGDAKQGLALLQRARALAGTSGDEALIEIDDNESSIHFDLCDFDRAREVALRGWHLACQRGRESSSTARDVVHRAADALIAQGRTAEAEALVDPLTNGPVRVEVYPLHLARVKIDMLRGDFQAAADLWQQIPVLTLSNINARMDTGQLAAELAVWAGRPADAVQEVRQVLALYQTPDLTVFCGRLLGVGMRACADLAELARARRDSRAETDALVVADELATWIDQMGGAPFADHPAVLYIPADRAAWEAERTRLTGASDPGAWSTTASIWQDLGCPHLAGYARWRQAEAQLDSGEPTTTAATALSAAAAAAVGHAPLQACIRALAERARIQIQAPVAAAPPPASPTPYRLTQRELAVLRLLAAGQTNAQIGAELYISPKTAGVHVTSILRKLGVSGRVQAATLAERAGLLGSAQP